MRGYSSRQEFARCFRGRPSTFDKGRQPCLDEDAKLEILERRIRSLEHLFNEPQDKWKVVFRTNTKRTSSRLGQLPTQRAQSAFTVCGSRIVQNQSLSKYEHLKGEVRKAVHVDLHQ